MGVNGFFGNRDHPLSAPESVDEIARSLETAVRVGARQLHLFSNAIAGGRVVPTAPLPAEALHAAFVENLQKAAELVRGTGVTLVLEHLNTVFLPGYLWGDVTSTALVAREVNDPAVGVVFDAFHQQLCGGRLSDHLEAVMPWLVRFDVAEVPGRYEPGVGEIDF